MTRAQASYKTTHRLLSGQNNAQVDEKEIIIKLRSKHKKHTNQKQKSNLTLQLTRS